MTKLISLDDKYAAEDGTVLVTGTQALVRLPVAQVRRDRAAGLNTGAFISGYRGSPLGGYDQQLVKAKRFLDPYDVVFQPGLNEDLAATAVWGSQQLHLSPGARKDGIVGLWYGKGPGVDRCGDVLKHANAAGSSAHGGVLAIAGDDHTCKSSSIPHQSDHAFISALMPMLYPSSVHEFLELGLIGIGMSRYSGSWIGYKVISETVETTTVIDLAQESRAIRLPTDFELPDGGLNLRWPDPPLAQDARLQEIRPFAAHAFARANGVDRTVFDARHARFGIVASGKAYEDVRQALAELGLREPEWEAIGLRFYKVRMPWPLEPEGIRRFSAGLEEVLIVEERREIIENQIKQQLFNWRADVRPRIIGKFDHEDRPVLPHSAGLTVSTVAQAIAARVLRLDLPEGLGDRIRERLAAVEAAERRVESYTAPVIRLPHTCPGCPHNTSTRVPEGSKAMAGIGCHFMVQWMDRRTDTFTHMGAEGVPWTAIGRFTDERHRFVNLGDGTYFHSGHLAIRQSVAAGANITYKILYNDAVAMTGGQSVDGVLTPQQITHQMFHEGVARIQLLTDRPDVYEAADLAPGTVVRHRDEIDATMRELREVAGVTVIVFEQTCAAEKRRRRKRGTAEDPDIRLWINPAVCENCGDCTAVSNCIAVEPVETELGRKRRINQSSCNKDLSCGKGFCPSFVTVRGAKAQRPTLPALPDASTLPEPVLPPIDRAWNIAVTGVGGTGVLTIGALLAMAAHLEGKRPMVLDMAGLAQKGGAVLSHVRIARADRPVAAPRIAAGGADLLLAADSVVAASRDSLVLCDPARTHAVMDTHNRPVSNFVRERDFDFKQAAVARSVERAVRGRDDFRDFSRLAVALCGDEMAVNVLMLGYAWQRGLVPLELASIAQAIEMNGVAVAFNLAAFDWGRHAAHDPAGVERLVATDRSPVRPMAELSTDEIVRHRVTHLTAYGNAALAQRYERRVERFAQRTGTHDPAGALRRTVAHTYARVLSYKDEYEVARLYSDPAFREGIAQAFAGDVQLSLNLAPPLLTGRDSDGRPRKRAFGAWILPVFAVLARFKALRGTPFDPFGRTAERRMERELIRLYEADLDFAEAHIATADRAAIAELLALLDEVRGFGPVKMTAYETVMARRDLLRRRIAVGEGAMPLPVAAE